MNCKVWHSGVWQLTKGHYLATAKYMLEFSWKMRVDIYNFCNHLNCCSNTVVPQLLNTNKLAFQVLTPQVFLYQKVIFYEPLIYSIVRKNYMSIITLQYEQD